MEKTTSKQNKTWLTITLCFVIVFCGLGLWAQKGLFVVPMTEALDMDRTLYSFVNTIRYSVTAIINIFFGYLVAKFGTRKLIILGFIALTLAPLCYAFANGVWLLYLGGALLGVGFSFASTAIIGYVVNKACRRNKGTIMGLVLCANGVAGSVVAFVISPIISSGTFGYRNAFYIMTLVSLFALLVIIILYREPKQTPVKDGEVLSEKDKKANWVGIDYSQATKKVYFYLACVCIFLTGVCLTGVVGNYAAHFTDRGVSSERLNVIAGIYTTFLAVFKFLKGIMYDRFGLRITITSDFVAALLSIMIMLFIDGSFTGFVLGVICSVLFGIAIPLETVLLPIYSKDLFGEKSFAKVLGVFVSLNQVGYAVGDPIMNSFYSLTGSYDLGIIVCGILILITIILLQFVISSANKLKRQDDCFS
ncbi:MAG: MFS transporter [Clostridia bacterium]|nr:MFS transporter [Clostridia bacterium]